MINTPIDPRSRARFTQKRRTIDRASRWFAIGALSIGLYAPMLFTFTTFGQVWKLTENRPLANIPKIHAVQISEILAFVNGLRSFVRDRFGLRAALIHMRSALMVKALHVSPNPAVILGDDEWLFYELNHSLENFARENPWPEAELERSVEVLRRRADWLRRHGGAKYVYVIIPAKETLYPGFMPEYLRQRRQRSSQPSRLDQLSTRMKSVDEMLFVDLRPAMLEQARSERLYQKTDTHWNQRGAFVAYQAIIAAAITKGYLDRPPESRSNFRESAYMTRGMDLTAMMGIDDLFTEEQLTIEPRITPSWIRREWKFERGGDAPRVVVFGDSFLPLLAPYLAEQFSGGTFIQDDRFATETITAEKPRLIIHEMAERKLIYPILNEPGLD